MPAQVFAWCLVGVLFGVFSTPALAQPQEAAKAPALRSQLTFDFRKPVADLPSISLFGAEIDNLARTDADGLRISLPAGRGDTRTVGLESSLRLRGDFDIRLAYEMITIGEPVDKYGSSLVMRVTFDSPSPMTAVISRKKMPQRHGFGVHKVIEGPDGKDKYVNNGEEKASEPRGKLRLSRIGSVVQYAVADGEQDFRVVQSVDFGLSDVRQIRLEWNTMFKPVALDARIRELDVTAKEIVGGIPVGQGVADAPPPAPDSPLPPTEQRSSGIRIMVFLLSLLAAALVLAVCLALFLRRRAGSERNGVSLVQCASCGKKLSVKPELVGKNVRCPQCGNIVSSSHGE